MKLSQNTKDWLAVAAGIVVLVLLLVTVVFSLWARVAAPCDKIDWLPVKELPGRCLPGGRG